MNIKIKSKHLFIPIIAIALAYIFLGLVGVYSWFKIDPELSRNLDTAFLVSAVGLLVYMNRLRKQESAAKEEDERRAKNTEPAAEAEPSDAGEAPAADTGGKPLDTPADKSS